METPKPIRYRLYTCTNTTTITVIDGTPLTIVRNHALASINKSFKSDSIRDTGVTFENPVMENGDMTHG
jgi:hypothetical protein